MTTQPKILIVDDVKAIADIISKILEQEDINSDVVYEGADAIEKIKTHSYKLVITDVLMPRNDGFDVIDAIHCASPETKIIVMTGGGVRISAAETLKAIGEKTNIALQKPVSKDQLLEAIYSLVDKVDL